MKAKPSAARFLGKRRVGSAASMKPPSIPSQIGPVRPMTLILMSLFLLAGVGTVTNSMAASGLISLAAPPSTPVNSCTITNYLSCYYGYQYNAPTGCDAAPANCQVGGSSGIASIFNHNSPFTVLFSGNVLAFLSVLAGSPPISANIYQVTGLPTTNIVQGVCTAKYIGNATSGATYITLGCSQTDAHYSVLPVSVASLLSPNPNAQNQTAVPFVGLTIQNATNPMGYPYKQGVYYQSSMCTGLAHASPNPGTYSDIIDGCQYYYTGNTHDGASANFTTYYYFTANVNASVYSGSQAYGGSETFNYCNTHYGLTQLQCPLATIPVTLQPENWDVYSCGVQLTNPNGAGPYVNLGGNSYWGITLPPITPQCAQMEQSITNYNSNSGDNTGLSIVLLFLAGIFLFLMGSGIRFNFNGSFFGTGGGVGAGSNDQGSRLAQALGLFLLAWIPLYSEFGAWITSGLLGSTGLEALMLLIVYGGGFIGVFWQILSYQ